MKMKVTMKMKARLPVPLDRRLSEMSFLFAFGFRTGIGGVPRENRKGTA
jgi:hypothetical protein